MRRFTSTQLRAIAIPSTLTALTAALAILLAAPLASLAEEDEADVRLRWAFGVKDPGASKPTAIERDTAKPSGSRLKFLIEPLCDCSVYLVYQDSGEEIHLLYPESLGRAADGGPTYVPPGEQWFELDQQTGFETFFLLASVEPLADLEKLLGRYASAPAAGKAEVGDAVIREIRRLNKAHRNFSRPVEKPVIIGGQTRGGPSEAAEGIDRIAVEISAERFYSKTITIDHQS